MTNLPDFLHSYEPPDLKTEKPETHRSSTRPPNKKTGEMMDSLPDSTLHVKHLADILSDLSGLLSQSWTQETLDDDVGPSWDAYTRNFSDFARHNELRNETKDLSGVYIHQLFSPVNRIAERSEGKLKPETYEPGEMRSAFTPPLSALRVGQHGDHYATLRPQGDSVRRPLQRVAVEKKLLTSVKTIAMVAGVDAARAEAEAGGVGQEGGYTIRKGEDGDGNERYYASEEVETAVIDAVVQTVEYMDAGRCPIGLLTNYDAYIVILRVSQSGIALSSPVLRKATSRNSLGPLKNEMSVLDLLLALLLYTARPGRLKGSVWSGLYVREIRREEPTHAKRKNEEGSGSRSGKRKGKIKQREEESEDGGGQSGRGLTERTDEDVGPSAGQEWHGTPVRISRKRPREFDKATTTMTTTETTFFPTSVDVSFSSEGEDQRIVTPTSFTFDHPNSQSLPSNSKRHPKHDPHLGPVLHLDYDPRHVPPVLSSLELEPLTMTSFYPVNRSDLWEIEPLERDLDIVLHRLIVVGNYFRTFSASMPPRTLDPERPSRSPSIIVKFAYLQDPEDSEELNSTSGSEAMQAVENEWKVLNGPLRDLQDRQIPKVYGMWRSGCGDWAMLVLEHIEGEQLEPGRELSRVEMGRVMETYGMLHERRVVHGDVQARHVFLGRDGRARLIDFDRARMGATDWDLEREKEEVRKLFGSRESLQMR